jgi:hypothetical protein
MIMVMFIACAVLSFGLWMGVNAKTGPQSTMGTLFVFIGAIALLIMLMLQIPAHAHDHSRPELDGWFKGLQSSSKAPCCDGSDAMRLDDVDWISKGGHYQVRLEGEWIDVPDDAIVGEPNRAGPTMVWPWRTDGKLNRVRCFMPGSMT